MNSSTNSAIKITAMYLLFFTVYIMCEPPIGYGAPNQNNYNYPNNNDDYDDYSYDTPTTTTTEAQSYEFGYKVKDDYSGSNFHQQESSDGNQVKGEYRVALPDGRTQIVTYWADWKSGFHANVRYEGEANYPENNNLQQQQQQQHYGPPNLDNAGYNYHNPRN